MLKIILFILACMVLLHGCNATSPDETMKPSAGSATVPSSAQADLYRMADQYLATATPGSAAYRIGPMDIIDITVFGVPELTKTAQVSEAGTVNLPLLGDVKVSGKSANQVEHDLQNKLNGKYLKSAHVSVLIKEYNNNRVTITGAIKTQGVISLRGPTSLQQALAQIGGVDREVASSEVVIFKTENGQRLAARYDLSDIRSGKSEDPAVEAGDVIVVEDSMLKTSWNTVKQVLPLTSLAGTAVMLGGL